MASPEIESGFRLRRFSRGETAGPFSDWRGEQGSIGKLRNQIECVIQLLFGLITDAEAAGTRRMLSNRSTAMPDRIQLLEKQIEKPVEKDSASSAVKASWEIGIRSDLLRDFEVTGFKQAAKKPAAEPPAQWLLWPRDDAGQASGAVETVMPGRIGSVRLTNAERSRRYRENHRERIRQSWTARSSRRRRKVAQLLNKIMAAEWQAVWSRYDLIA